MDDIVHFAFSAILFWTDLFTIAEASPAVCEILFDAFNALFSIAFHFFDTSESNALSDIL